MKTISGILLFIACAFYLCSCSRVGNYEYVQIGSPTALMYEKWGKPQSEEFAYADKKGDIDDWNGLQAYSDSVDYKGQVVSKNIIIHYYCNGFDHYKIISKNGYIIKRYHTNELGSGPFIEIDKYGNPLPYRFNNYMQSDYFYRQNNNEVIRPPIGIKLNNQPNKKDD